MDAQQQIDAYIANAQPFAQPILKKLRQIIHKNAPNLREEFKWEIPVFSGNSLVMGIGAFSKHVKLNFFQGQLIKDTYKLLREEHQA